MIRKIVLTNFMAHARTELQLAEGLTVLVGPNNIGKSTIALALKILARNTNSNFVMQHERKECSVAVETDEGHSIEWIKKKSPSYIINGQPKDRLGRGGTPPELDLTLRLAPVEFEDKDFEPHFGDQKSPVFLINRPASQIAQFFSTTSDAEKLVAMQRLHHRNRTEMQTQSKSLAAKNESIQLSLSALEELPELQAEWVSLEREALSLESLAKEIADLESLVGTYVQLKLERQLEMHRSTCFELLAPLATIHPTEHLKAAVTAWMLTEETQRSSQVCSQLLSDLVAAPKLADEHPLANMTRDLGLAHSKFAYCEACNRTHAELSAPCQWLPTEQLAQAVNQIAQSTRDYNRLGQLLSALDSLESTPVAIDTKPLSEVILAVEKTSGQFDQNQSLLADIQDEAVALEADAEKWLSTEPTCDTCGGKLSVDSVRFKSHRHGK